MTVEKSYMLLPVQTKDEFLRKMLIKFAQDENVDPKILESNFKVEQFEKKFYLFKGNVESSYTCVIGNNRTENYIEMQKKQKLIKQPDGSSKWEWITEPVNKTRTVTDWSPFSSTAKGAAKGVVTEDGSWTEECYLVKGFIFTNEKKEQSDDNEITASIISGGKKDVASEFALSIERNLPGDKHKDFSHSSTVEITEIESYIVPYYTLSYDYKGKMRSCEHCACSKEFSLTLDNDEQEKLKYMPIDTKKAADEDVDVKKAKKIMKICWLSMIPAVILSVILPNILPAIGFVGPIINIACFVMAIVFTLKKNSKFNKVKADLDAKEQIKKQNILNEKHKKVYESLKSVLAKYKLNSITFDEVYSVK